MSLRIGVVVKGYPRLSETFIAQELFGLQESGAELQIISLRHPTDKSVHPVHNQIKAAVKYLPEYLHHEPWRVLKSWWSIRKRPAYRQAKKIWLQDLRRDITRNRIRRFGQALVLAAELSPDIRFLYAHFLHTPASVTRYAAVLCRIPFGISAHAKDIWTSPEWEKQEKILACDWLVTCTRYGATHLRELVSGTPAHGKVHLMYHGLDLRRFPCCHQRPHEAEEKGEQGPIRILSVGRVVAKKGYSDLIEALARLPDDLNWKFVHIGHGPLREQLRKQAAGLGIADRIEWHGPAAQAEVLEQYRLADIFVLASKIANDGDRDGLPNVLMEAQSQGLACIATATAAIPELIRDGETGLLAPPGDPAGLAGKLVLLASDPMLRDRLGEAGRNVVHAEFSFVDGIGQLNRLLGQSLHGTGR